MYHDYTRLQGKGHSVGKGNKVGPPAAVMLVSPTEVVPNE